MILVLGARGMLGWTIVRYLASQAIPHLAVDYRELDICNELQIHRTLKSFKFSVVINCAAYTDVQEAEKNPVIARKINADAITILAKACEQYKVGLLHFSTDFVFDGTSEIPRREVDKACPLNVYGQTKYEGELNLMNNNSDYKILRLQWLYGFTGGFFRKIIDIGLKNGMKVDVIRDQFGSPCSTDFVAKIVLDIVNFWKTIPSGVYHLTHDDYCSWYDYAVFAMRQLDVSMTINPISHTQFKTNVIRPVYCLMDCTKLKTILRYSSFGTWHEDMTGFMIAYKNQN
jgi:dTDP-4-dehydrorhamnose reductase